MQGIPGQYDYHCVMAYFEKLYNIGKEDIIIPSGHVTLCYKLKVNKLYY